MDPTFINTLVLGLAEVDSLFVLEHNPKINFWTFELWCYQCLPIKFTKFPKIPMIFTSSFLYFPMDFQSVPRYFLKNNNREQQNVFV